MVEQTIHEVLLSEHTQKNLLCRYHNSSTILDQRENSIFLGIIFPIFLYTLCICVSNVRGKHVRAV